MIACPAKNFRTNFAGELRAALVSPGLSNHGQRCLVFLKRNIDELGIKRGEQSSGEALGDPLRSGTVPKGWQRRKGDEISQPLIERVETAAAQPRKHLHVRYKPGSDQYLRSLIRALNSARS